MNYFLRKIEAALLPTASLCTPEGSDPKAIAQQWMHAIASRDKPFRQNIRPILVELPPKELMTAFTDKVVLLYAQITANLYRICNLVTLRDTLLPKLLSGELNMNVGAEAAEAVA
ncbi:MAG: hypothetical protein ABL869_05675 [Candidatus Nitrotoga sp.]